jgi:hypothetical protein
VKDRGKVDIRVWAGLAAAGKAGEWTTATS